MIWRYCLAANWTHTGGAHDDIVSDIMNHKVVGRRPRLKVVKKVKKELSALLECPSGTSSDDLEAFAKKLGRKQKNRGKEPTWVREDNPRFTFPLSIPNHSGGKLKNGTARSIIDQLLSDCDQWELELNEEDNGDDDEDED